MPRRKGPAPSEVKATKQTKSVMLSMRVSENTKRWLEDAARRRELPISAGARMFMLERQSQEPVPPGVE